MLYPLRAYRMFTRVPYLGDRRLYRFCASCLHNALDFALHPVMLSQLVKTYDCERDSGKAAILSARVYRKPDNGPYCGPFSLPVRSNTTSEHTLLCKA